MHLRDPFWRTHHVRLLFSLEFLVQLAQARRPVVVRIGGAGRRVRARVLAQRVLLLHLAGRGDAGVVELEVHEHGGSTAAGVGGGLVARDGAGGAWYSQKAALRKLRGSLGVGGGLHTLRWFVVKAGVQGRRSLKRG